MIVIVSLVAICHRANIIFLSDKTGIPNQIISFQVFILSIAPQLLFCQF